MLETYSKWFVQDQDLVAMTELRARDLIIKCFFEAQKETIAQSGKRLHQQVSDQYIMDNVVGAVRLAFRECQADFDRPTRYSLADVVQTLARKSLRWGTPPVVVAHHKHQIEKVLDALG